MLFKREASEVVARAGLDPLDVDINPLSVDHRAAFEAAIFGRVSGDPAEDLLVRLVLKERAEGHRIYDAAELGLSASSELDLSKLLTKRYKSLLLLFDDLARLEVAEHVDLHESLICLPSSRQDAYVFHDSDRDYIIVSYGLVSLLRFAGDSLMIREWLGSEAFSGEGSSLVGQYWDRLYSRLPDAVSAGSNREDIFPWAGGILSSYEYLDSVCCLGFSLWFVCKHETVHVLEGHSRLLDPASSTYTFSGSVSTLAEQYCISTHQALELVADEHALYSMRAVDAWPQLSMSMSAYLLAIGFARADDRGQLRFAYARADNLVLINVGVGNAATFGPGVVALSVVSGTLLKLMEDKAIQASQLSARDDVVASGWSEFLADFERVLRYLWAKAGSHYSRPMRERQPVFGRPTG